MTWVAVAVVGSAVVGGVASNQSAKKGAAATKKAAKNSTELSQYQFEQGLEQVAPFKAAGESALPGLQGIANEEVTPFAYRNQNEFLNNYFTSPEYAALNSQASDQVLRGRSATGGLRGGGTSVDLAKIAPMLGIDALNRANQQDASVYSINQGAKADQFNRLYGLANMGANVASGNQSAGMNFASEAGRNAMAAGQAQNLAYQQQGQAISGLATDLSSVYAAQKMGYFNNPNQGKI